MNLPDMCDMKESVFYQNYSFWYWALILCSALMAAGSLLLGMTSVGNSIAHKTRKEILYAIWVLGPPIWFFIEYFYLFRQHGKPECIETFRYGQELASRIWLALVAVLGFLFFGKELLGK